MIFTPVSRVFSAERRRNLFTVDDGTGTVEFTFRLDQDVQGGRGSEKQDPPRSTQEPIKKRSSFLIPVGSVVRVQGRVRAKWNSREIYGESIRPSIPKLVLEGHSDDKCAERCHGPRVELDHWRQVVALHEKRYFVPEKFVIPSSSSGVDAEDVPHTPKSTATDALPSISTPSTSSTPSSSASLSPQRSSKGPSVRLTFFFIESTFLTQDISFLRASVTLPVFVVVTSQRIHSAYM